MHTFAAAAASDCHLSSEQDEKKQLDDLFAIYKAGGGGGSVLEDIEAVRWQKGELSVWSNRARFPCPG